MKLKETIRKYVPPRYTFLVSHIKNSIIPGGFSKKIYSGNGEDVLLNDYLFKHQSKGFYVDVGAFHPKLTSNTYLLHKRGWNGINIDPNPESINLFKKDRPNDINILAGVANEESELTYYRFAHAGNNTFSKEHAEKKGAKEWSTLLSTEKVKCYKLSTLLDKYVPVNTTIDLMDVDVEEFDLEVLKSNDWNKYRPRVLMIEDRDFRDELTESKIYQYLLEQKYAFRSYYEMTLIMVDATQE